jgi:GTP-binding protein YchF
MEIGIIGLAQTGKKTVFRLLTGVGGTDKPFDPHKSVQGVAAVEDPRFDKLLSIYSPKKQTRARIQFTLLPKIEGHNISESDVFDEMVDVDTLCHVVRVFEDDSIYHVSGSVDPGRDIDFVNSELLLHDLLFMEKRLERIENKLKKIKDETILKEKALLLKLKPVLEEERPLRLYELTREEEKLIKSYPFLTRKTNLVVLNVSDEQLDDAGRPARFEERFRDQETAFVEVPAEAELEIAALESESDRAEFRRELGIESRAIDILTRTCINALGLVSFFTVSRDELRQWFVRRGSTAAEAAGAIHTDMQRGFIRAEVMHYQDIVEQGSEEAVKSQGKFYLKGRDYIVEDGDLLAIRFSV